MKQLYINAYRELSKWLPYEYGEDRAETIQRRKAIAQRFMARYGVHITSVKDE